MAASLGSCSIILWLTIFSFSQPGNLSTLLLGLFIIASFIEKIAKITFQAHSYPFEESRVFVPLIEGQGNVF